MVICVMSDPIPTLPAARRETERGQKGEDVFPMPIFQPTRLFSSLDKLFVKIFLWFWITTCGVIIAVFVSSQVNRLQIIEPPSLFATVAPILAAEAVRVYEAGGAEAFAQFSQDKFDDRERKLYLLDGAYRDVLWRPITADGLRVAHAARTGHLTIVK